MKKVVKAFYFFDSQTGEYDFWNFRPYTEDGRRIVLAEKEIEFEIPDDFDPRPLQIKELEKKQQEAAAAFHALTTEIKRQISELQALEFAA